MTVSAATISGYHNGLQGHFAEQYVRALASAAGFSVGKKEPEPVGVDLTIGYTRRQDLPWPTQTIEISVKSTRNTHYDSDGNFLYDIKADAHDVLCGEYLIDFDIRRYLVVVGVPPHRHKFAEMQSRSLVLSNEAYILDLMGQPRVGPGATQRRLSFPAGNLLTPLRLAEIVLQDAGKAQQWATI